MVRRGSSRVAIVVQLYNEKHWVGWLLKCGYFVLLVTVFEVTNLVNEDYDGNIVGVCFGIYFGLIICLIGVLVLGGIC